MTVCASFTETNGGGGSADCTDWIVIPIFKDRSRPASDFAGPKGREEVPVQIARLLHAHEIVLKEARTMARRAVDTGDDGTNDLVVSYVIRRSEFQVWFVAGHVVAMPLVQAE